MDFTLKVRDPRLVAGLGAACTAYNQTKEREHKAAQIALPEDDGKPREEGDATPRKTKYDPITVADYVERVFGDALESYAKQHVDVKEVA